MHWKVSPPNFLDFLFFFFFLIFVFCFCFCFRFCLFVCLFVCLFFTLIIKMRLKLLRHVNIVVVVLLYWYIPIFLECAQTNAEVDHEQSNLLNVLNKENIQLHHLEPSPESIIGTLDKFNINSHLRIYSPTSFDKAIDILTQISRTDFEISNYKDMNIEVAETLIRHFVLNPWAVDMIYLNCVNRASRRWVSRTNAEEQFICLKV